MNFKATIALASIVTAFSVGAIAWWSASPSSPPILSPAQKAEQMAREFMLEKLRCPSTATFTDVTVTIDRIGSDEKWTVRGDVHSQNEYAAMVRDRFSVTFTHDGSWENVKRRALINGEKDASETFADVAEWLREENEKRESQESATYSPK